MLSSLSRPADGDVVSQGEGWLHGTAVIPTNSVPTDNSETTSAMVKLAGEIEESATDVVVCGMVR